MSNENKALVYRVHKELNNGNVGIFDEAFAPGYVAHVGTDINAAELKARFGRIAKAFPDVQYTVDNVIAEGDMLAFHRTVTGTQRGEFMGVPATGKKLKWIGLVMSRCEGGKIVEEWGLGNLPQVVRDAAA